MSLPRDGHEFWIPDIDWFKGKKYVTGSDKTNICNGWTNVPQREVISGALHRVLPKHYPSSDVAGNYSEYAKRNEVLEEKKNNLPRYCISWIAAANSFIAILLVIHTMPKANGQGFCSDCKPGQQTCPGLHLQNAKTCKCSLSSAKANLFFLPLPTRKPLEK